MKLVRMALLVAGVFVVSVLLAKGTAEPPPDGPFLFKGKPAPEIALTTFDGKPVRLSDHKGKVVLIDFWATWCIPCMQAMPHLQKLSTDEARKAKGLEVWAINAMEANARIEPFVARNNYTLTIPVDTDGKVAEQFKIDGLPVTLIVGRDGIIRDVFVGLDPTDSARELDEAIDKALAVPAPATQPH